MERPPPIALPALTVCVCPDGLCEFEVALRMASVQTETVPRFMKRSTGGVSQRASCLPSQPRTFSPRSIPPFDVCVCVHPVAVAIAVPRLHKQRRLYGLPKFDNKSILMCSLVAMRNSGIHQMMGDTIWLWPALRPWRHLLHSMASEDPQKRSSINENPFDLAGNFGVCI
eukprot:1793349-Amphidinium_carterae.1